MYINELLLDGFVRAKDAALAAIKGLSEADLARRVHPASNPVGWLVWHLARVQDDHVAGVAGIDQVWTSRGWAERFGLPYETGAIGYGQSTDEVGDFRADRDLLAGYLEEVHARTAHYLTSLTEADLDKVIDHRWDPPVTLGVRLVSVISDDLQHAGQAAYVRGLLS